jgi:hypothetical protein
MNSRLSIFLFVFELVLRDQYKSPMNRDATYMIEFYKNQDLSINNIYYY